MIGDLLMCEFHDATFEGIAIDGLFVVHIAFSEFPCFYTTGKADVADIWMCRAELQISGARGLTARFSADAEQWVSDLEITSCAEEAVDPYNLVLLRGTRWLSAELRMLGNALIRIEGGVAKLTIGDRLRFLEQTDWP